MKKLYNKILLIISCFVMMICSLSFINLSTNYNDLRYESNRRYSLVGTEVPNSGMVEKVYFNTMLNEEEVVNLIKGLTYIDINGLTDSGNIILATSDYSLALAFDYHEASSADSSTTFAIFAVNPASGTLVDTIMYKTTTNDSGVYWGFNEYSINSEVINDLMGMPVGTENDKLTSLFSITPFVEENTIINDLLSSIGLGITSIVGVVVNGIKESFLEFVYVDKDSDNLLVSDLAYFLFAMLGFSIAVGLIWLVIFMFKRRE